MPTLLEFRWRRLMASLALLAALVTAGGGPLRAAPAPQTAPSDGMPAVAYTLTDTWEQRPWALKAGHYGNVADTSSAPDGTVYILDSDRAAADLGRPPAIHVLDARGAPRGVFPVPGQASTDRAHLALRLDVDPADGTIVVLSESRPRWTGTESALSYRVDRLDGEGRPIDHFETVLLSESSELPQFRSYVDVAARSDGRIYLVRQGMRPFCHEEDAPPIELGPEDDPFYALDVYAADGELLEHLQPPTMLIPYGVDVALDGRIYLLVDLPGQ